MLRKQWAVELEEYLLFSAIDESGNNLDQESVEKLISCVGYEHEEFHKRMWEAE